MSKKPKPQVTKKKTAHDLASFEKLPEQTKKLMKLKDQDEKTTGPDHVVTTRKIQDETRDSQP